MIYLYLAVLCGLAGMLALCDLCTKRYMFLNCIIFYFMLIFNFMICFLEKNDKTFSSKTEIDKR